MFANGTGFTGLMHLSTNNDNTENDDDTDVTMAAEDSVQ